MADILLFTNKGLYCPDGDFYIDPHRKVPHAVITHAHSDHAHYGMKNYYCHKITSPILLHRLAQNICIKSVEYDEPFYINQVKITLYPAGHIPGSAQVLVEHKGERWLITGDFKTQDDNVSTAWQAVPCDVMITECTFGKQEYVFQHQEALFENINNWWRNNKQEGKTSIILAYALGKAQRIINNVDNRIGKIYAHHTIEEINKVLRKSGVPIRDCISVKNSADEDIQGNLLIATPAIIKSRLLNSITNYSLAFASGWTLNDNEYKRFHYDVGFPLSDHADYNELLFAIEQCKPSRVITTHGFTKSFAEELHKKGIVAEDGNKIKLNQFSLF